MFKFIPKFLFYPALFLLILSAGCEPAKWVGDGPTRVAVLGDSLTWLAETEEVETQTLLSDELADEGYAAHVNGVRGYTSVQINDSLRRQVGVDPLDILIVAAGTNDLNYQVPAWDSYNALVAMTEDVPCVRFIDPRTDRPGFITWAYVVDRVVEQHPNAERVVQPLTIPTIFDKVHHTHPEGTAMYRQLILDAVEDCEE